MKQATLSHTAANDAGRAQKNRHVSAPVKPALKRPVWPVIIFSLLMSQSILWVRIREGQGSDPNNLFGSQFVIFLLCLSCSFAGAYILRLKKVPSLWLNFLLAAVVIYILNVVFYYGSPFEDYPLHPVRDLTLGNGLLRLISRGLLISFLILPYVYYLNTLFHTRSRVLELKQSKRLNTELELQLLREQMSPHFLFNSLTILKSGAKEPWVKEYTMQLANIYRYLSHYSRKRALSTLEEELEFINAYGHVMKQRFGNGLCINIRIPKILHTLQLPPFTLQLLVENAVKHNILSEEKPLLINIFMDLNYLIVENNLQEKHLDMEPLHPGMGLDNLRERHRLLLGKEIEVEKTNSFFIVRVPLD